MQETLHDHHTPISIGGRPICNLGFAGVVLMGGSCGKLQDLTYRLVDRVTTYGMKVSTKKSKIMTNSTNNISADISTKGQKLEKVTSLKSWEQPYARMAPAHQDCLSNDSNRQTKQDLGVQHHQPRKQIQVSCHLHPPLRLLNMD